MINRFLTIIFVAFFLPATSPLRRCPRGGLNRDGCHRETATGGYDCHREKSDDRKTWETVG